MTHRHKYVITITSTFLSYQAITSQLQSLDGVSYMSQNTFPFFLQAWLISLNALITHLVMVTTFYGIFTKSVSGVGFPFPFFFGRGRGGASDTPNISPRLCLVMYLFFSLFFHQTLRNFTRFSKSGGEFYQMATLAGRTDNPLE